MQAFLISGGVKTERSQYIAAQAAERKISAFDTISIAPAEDEEHIGIGTIRDFKSRAFLAPRDSAGVMTVIESAHTMTTEAQNALLKILEEPPERLFIYIETEYPDKLLPTILSRCQAVRIPSTQPTVPDASDLAALVESFLTKSPGHMLSSVDANVSDRNSAKTWTLAVTAAARQLLLSEVSGAGDAERMRTLTKLLHNLQRALGELQVNVTPKMAIDIALLARLG